MTSKMTQWRPDFLGIGAMKSATYWFYTCLVAHPEVCMGARKEIHFFDTPSNQKKGVDWYESFFSHCQQDTKQGEITPNYINTPGTAALIQQHYPDVKLFACLRNPVERAYSHYRFNVVRKGHMSIYDSFEQALEKDESLVEMGMYCKQLKAYFERFPKENILILLYDDIGKDPIGILRSLYSFIGVDSSFVPEMVQTRKGVTGTRVAEYKIPFINPLLFRIRDRIRGGLLDRVLGSMGVKAWLRTLILKNRRMVDAKSGQEPVFPPLSDETYQSLVTIFEQDIKGLEELLDRDLNIWLRR